MKFIIDNKIPFIEGRLENSGDVIYSAPDKIDAALVKDADALIIRTRTRCDEDLLKGSNVKLVATATIGTDHIDLPWCEANGITVRNAAGCNAPGVAQYVWSSLLREGFDPSSSTLGIVGYGHVGSIVAEWGRALGARILVCDPPRKEDGHTDNDYIPLARLLEESDAITLHTPFTKTGKHPTFHLIGEREMSMTKPGVILINTSRGPVVDNKAWLCHLEKNKSKAIIDVWENEPAISLPLLEAATVATPHIAGYSFEGKQRATRMALRAVADFFNLQIPTDDLCGDYAYPENGFPENASAVIINSYNPFADTDALRANPANFEKLRGDYDYRHEPTF